MGSAGTTQLILLLVAVAIVAGLCGFVASGLRRRTRRAPVYFSIGFGCGLLAGAILRRRHRGWHALGAVVRQLVDHPLAFAVSRVRLLPTSRRPRI